MSITPETVACIDIGSVLANGAVVAVASSIRPVEEGSVAYGLVLARTVSGTWATWLYRMGTRTTHTGNYFSSLTEADKDLRARCEKHGLRVL